jgi:hypothetical protein
MASSTQESFRAINSKIDNIAGIKTLYTERGLELVEVIESIHLQTDKFTNLFSELSERMTRLEKKYESGPAKDSSSDAAADSKTVKDLVLRLDKFEKSLASEDLRGPSGPAGPAGPKGPKVDKLQDIKDVCLDGVTEGAILVYRSGKWVVEVPE